MPDEPILRTDVPGVPCRRGKVRDVYDLGEWLPARTPRPAGSSGEWLAVVATDRVSAFDWVLPTGIPGKGRLLTDMTAFWLNWLGVPHHLISRDLADLPPAFRDQPDVFAGRTMLVTKTTVVPVECVARGYLLGSGWKEYRATGAVCGVPLPPGLREADRLPEPIFTPTTKADSGHDAGITFAEMQNLVGPDLAADLRARTLDVYRRAAEYAAGRGVIIADTKLEWGIVHSPELPAGREVRAGGPTGEILLIDEVLTPDSSRFWPADEYRPGSSPPSFDKQFIRDWLEASAWDKASPPPPLPAEVVAKSAEKYREAVRRLVG